MWGMLLRTDLARQILITNVDPGSPADGRIFVSWTTPLEKRFTGHVRFSVSNDNGKHFSDPIIVNDNLNTAIEETKLLVKNFLSI